MARTLSSSGETAAAAALRGQTPSPSPRSASTSLQAAAAVNAGLQQEDSRRMYDFLLCLSAKGGNSLGSPLSADAQLLPVG